MSYKTSIGFCIKPHIEVPRFEEIEDCFDEIVRDERGTLYVGVSLKWYRNEVEVVKKVHEFLDALNPDDYYFVELDTNQDDAHTDTLGSWFQNDFNLGTSIELTYD